MFEYKNETYTLEELQFAAKEQGLNFDTYLDGMKNLGMVEKQIDSTTMDPTGESYVMGSDLEDGSLEPQEYSKTREFLANTALGWVEGAKDIANIREGFTLAAIELALKTKDIELTGEEKQKALDVIRQSSKLSPMLSASTDYDPIITTLEENIPEYDTQTITEALLNENYGEAGWRTVNAAFRSMPSLVAAASGYGGLSVLAMSAAGGKFEEEFEANPEQSTLVTLANAGATGVTEAGFELVTRGILKRAGLLSQAGDVEGARQLLEGGALQIVKNIGWGTTTEGLSESATELTVALIDAIPKEYGGLGKSLSKDLWYRLGDAGIVGSYIGGKVSSVGEISKTSKNAKTRAEAILMDEDTKHALEKKINTINKLSDDLTNASPEGKELIQSQIDKELNEVASLKQKSSSLLSSLKGEDLVNYAKNVTEINKYKKIVNNSKVDSERDIASKNYNDLKKANDKILSDAVKKAAAITTETVRKQAGKIADLQGVEGIVTEASSQEIADAQGEKIARLTAERDSYQEILDDPNSTPQNKKIAEKNIIDLNQQIENQQNADLAFGYIDEKIDDQGNLTGDFEIILNTDKPMLGTAAHEFMHKVLFKTLGGNKTLQDNIGNALINFINDVKGGAGPAFINRMSAYVEPVRDTDGNIIKDKDGNVKYEKVSEFGEETVTVLSESLFDGTQKYDEGLMTKLGDIIRQTLQRYGLKNIEFNTGRDVYNFIKDYNRSIQKGYVSKAITEAAVKGVKGKLVTKVKAEPVAKTKMSKEASDNVQRIYEDRGVGGAFDIIEQFKPITSRLVEKRSQAPNFDRQLLTDEIETGRRGIFDLIREYDPKSGVPLAAYINKFLPARAIEASKRILGEEFVEDVTERVDIAAEEVTPEVKVKRKPKKIVLTDRFGVTKKVNEAIKKVLPKLDIKNLTFKKLKNELPQITGEMFGISPKKLVSLANITKKELQAAQMFINKNADLLIQMLPEGSTTSGTATGVPNSLLKAFYTKTDRAKMAKTGSTAGLAVQIKNKINKKEFLEVFGIIDGKPDRTDRNTSARVLALANLTGKMMTNQAVRQNLESLNDYQQTLQNIKDGTTNVMFSLEANEVFQKHNLPIIDVNNIKNGIENYNTFLDKMSLFATFLPNRFIRRVDLYKFGISNQLVYRYAEEQTKELGDSFLIGRHPDRVYYRPDTFFGKKINGKNVVILKNITQKQSDQYNKSGMDNFNIMINGIKKAIEANPNDKQLHAAIFMYLSSAGKDTSHPLRGAAEYIGGDVTATGEILFEHALQSANVRNEIMDAILDPKQDFNEEVKAIKKNYKLIGMSKKDAKILGSTTYIDENGDIVSYENNMGVGWDIFVDNWFDRYFNLDVNAINPNNFKVIKNGKTFTEEYNLTKSGAAPIAENTKPNQVLSKAMSVARTTSYSKDSKGITVLDFDDTLATTKSLVKYTAPDGTTGTLNAEEYASTYQDLQEQGYKFDFSEFNKVVDAKLAPLFQKALKLQKKFGPENMFVLTARPSAAQKAIFDYLKANGLNIPLKNITGLGNSTAEAKALWIADKVGEGYNDFYFADDALQNVQAVKNMLDQFDVKSKIQQAKVKFSKDMSTEFNDVLQDVTKIKSEKRFSTAKARKRGEGKGRFRMFIPPSHEDFVGLLYNFIGKGEKGNQHRDFFERALIKPLNRAYLELNAAKQSISNDYKNLVKAMPDARKKLTKKTPDGDFTYGDAVRVYLWDKFGFSVPGLSKTDQKELSDLVKDDVELQSFADAIGLISKQEEGYVEPQQEWEAGDVRTDLADATGGIGRQQFFTEFIENADVIFSQENLNKIEAAYGKNFREALEDILYRTKNGTNRRYGSNRLVNRFTDWINGAVGSTMFLNARSGILQQLSMVNFINYGDNNMFKAATAFANQLQYWKDYAMIFNSDFLKQRRSGIAFDVNGAELAQAVSKSKEPARAAIRHLLQKGFILTQIGDSNAIAMGGATFYRNRVNTYLKQGLTKKEAEKKAFTDFQEIAEMTQQSARPDMISQQQSSPLGKFILAFQNTPSQYARMIKKSGLDLINRRKSKPYKTQWQSDMSNISRILYYGTIQNLIFYGLQSAMFAMLFSDDDEDKEFFDKKRDRLINGSIDSLLRGMGVGGAIISTLKNTAFKIAEERGKTWGGSTDILMNELLQLSPPLGIKARKLSSAEKTLKYNKKVIKEMETFDIDNPIWDATGNVIEGVTNVPTARLHRKITNTREALNAENEWWQRLALALGWSKWDVGVKNEEIEAIKEEIKSRNKIKKKKKKKFGMQQKEILF